MTGPGPLTPGLPQFGILADALRRTTERLAGELAAPTRAAPDWSALDWTVARAVATMQGTSVLLATRLRWRGPAPWKRFLAGQQHEAGRRDALIGHLLGRLDDALRPAGIAAVALKGAALRGLGIYSPGERPMADIDLLVDADRLAGLDSVLGTLSYERAFATRRHVVYRPVHACRRLVFGEHIGNPLNIEVHTRIYESLPVSRIDLTETLKPDRPGPGLNDYPDALRLFVHLALHTAGGMRARAARQIQLHDLAALGARLSDTDWSALLALAPDNGWWLYPPLRMAEAYQPGSVPAAVLQETRGLCPRLLRFSTERHTLTDVSWSNLRIHAFPGLAWSSNVGEALRCLRSRIAPDRRALDELTLSRTNQPQLDRVRWYGVSHAERILRWLVSRPPRVQTLLSLEAAVEDTASRQ